MKSIFLCIIFTFGYSQINWDIEVVDSLFYAGACGSRNALCLDSNDTPHVVYSYFNVIPPDSGFKLMYAVKNGNVWHYEVIDTGTVLAFTGPSLQVDDNGIIHVSYYTRHVANPGSWARICFCDSAKRRSNSCHAEKTPLTCPQFFSQGRQKTVKFLLKSV